MITLKVKMKGGFVTQIQVDELLEVDGVAYQSQSKADKELELELMGQRLAFLEGRIEAIENIFTTQEVSHASS